jgi:hypothetical protein
MIVRPTISNKNRGSFDLKLALSIFLKVKQYKIGIFTITYKYFIRILKVSSKYT